MTKKIENIIKEFSSMWIGVVGDLMLDRTEKGIISPEQKIFIENVLQTWYYSLC